MLGSISDVSFPASPATPLTPTPCFRRPRASTLSAYTPPNAKSTSRRSAVVSRSSGPALSESSIACGVARDVIVTGVAADNRLSDASLNSVPGVLSQETINNAQRSVTGLGHDEELLTAKIRDTAKVISKHLGPKYLNASRIHGTKLKVPKPLPFKCLSPMKTLSLGVASSNLKKDHKKVSSLATVSELELSASRSGISLSKQESRCLGRSCSLDQGLSLLQGPLISDDVFTRRPRSSIQGSELRANGSPFGGHITATLILGHHDSLPIHSRNVLQNNRMWRSGGTTGLYDVSFVKRVFSVMRADDVGQDGQDARNVFSRESVWDYRKSAAPSVKPRSQRYSKRVAGKYDENDIFTTPTRKNRISRRGAAFSAIFREAKRNQDMAKPAPNKRTRHRSVVYELSPSPSIQRQLKVERIKRQRKLRQEMMSRVVSNRDSCDWFAHDA
ncbi:hypothetical protein APHAL10511_005005 [Amanita phalloides]|nr:hypothetical protein APHAL10511_005005 [Amanita phalloides]